MTSTAFSGTLIFAAADSPTAAGDAIPLRLHGSTDVIDVSDKRLEITGWEVDVSDAAGEYHIYLATANTDETGAVGTHERIFSSMDATVGGYHSSTPGFRALALEVGDNIWFKMPAAGAAFVRVQGVYHTD